MERVSRRYLYIDLIVLRVAAIVQAFHDTIHERSSQLLDVQRAAR